VIGDNAWLDAFVRLAAVLGLIILVVLILTYVERKFVGRIQMRLGPMRPAPTAGSSS
jgi:NADH:ubiquinone oxidoreductase subunit H